MKDLRSHSDSLGIWVLLVSSLFSFLSLISVEIALATPKCSDLFSPQIKTSPAVKTLITDPLASLFVNERAGEQTLAVSQIGLTPKIQAKINKAIHDLSALRLRLDQAKIQGPLSTTYTALEADYSKKEQKLLAYLEKYNIMTRAQLFESMRAAIRKIQSEKADERRRDVSKTDEEARRRKVHEEQIKNFVIDGTRAIFHRIEPGEFKMGARGDQVDVTITKPFDMMATPTTQIIWKKVAELANSRFGNKYRIDVDPSEFKGDTNPVEMVSYEDVQQWIEGLNELSRAGERSLARLIPGHKKGNVYRLPTDAEWEFVMRGRGQYTGLFHFGDHWAQLKDYAWFNGFPGGTQPVGKKKPLVINGREFFDMLGNVWEWVHDWYSENLTGGTDPQGPAFSSLRVKRGGGWDSNRFGLRSFARGTGATDDRKFCTGFRLARNAE